MRQRRQLQRELRLSHIMHNTDSRHFDEFGLPVLPDRMVMMFPPTYEDAMQQPQIPNSPPHKRSQYVSHEQPPPYTEYHHPMLTGQGQGSAVHPPVSQVVTTSSPADIYPHTNLSQPQQSSPTGSHS